MQQAMSINVKLDYSPTETPHAKELWLIDQLTMLAEAFGETGERVSSQRLQLYAIDLSDLTPHQLVIAFTRARRELKFFPKIAELRELAGIGNREKEQQDNVEAEAAFQMVIRHLERNGVEAGARSLPSRVQYSVRWCGGLFAFNHRLEVKSYPFLQRDFIAAYKQVPAAETLLPRLPGTFAKEAHDLVTAKSPE